MIEFKNLELSDKAWINACAAAEDSRSADFSFANMYMWDESFRQLVAEIGGRVAAKPKYRSHPFFAFPVGSGDLRAAVEELRDYAEKKGFPFCLNGVTETHRAQLEALYPGQLQFTPDRDHFDYLYEAEKLASLSGKKLHSKRNFVNRFQAEHDNWRFTPLTAETCADCLPLLEKWEDGHSADEQQKKSVQAERAAIARAFEHFDALGLEGGALYIGEEMVAFTVGEKISSDTYDVHFEKARADIPGTYPMINREFVRYILQLHPEIRYINREDDMGLEGLRKAKLSYAPVSMVEKYSVCFCGCGGAE